MGLSRMERRREQAARESATLTAIERAQAALAAADRFLEIAAEQQRLETRAFPSVEGSSQGSVIKPVVSRKTLREQGLLGGNKLPNLEVEITGVLARGTSASDFLSWDTTTLPVIARPRRDIG